MARDTRSRPPAFLEGEIDDRGGRIRHPVVDRRRALALEQLVAALPGHHVLQRVRKEPVGRRSVDPFRFTEHRVGFLRPGRVDAHADERGMLLQALPESESQIFWAADWFAAPWKLGGPLPGQLE